MTEAGILDEDDRVELLEGVIVEMSPQGPKHAMLIQRLCDPTFAKVPPDFVIRCQLPLTLSRDSEPEPDVSVVRRADAASHSSHPTTAALVCEVAGELSAEGPTDQVGALRRRRGSRVRRRQR